MTKKLVVITGANRGIGLSLTKEYLKRGDEVIAVCRKSSPELDALGVEVVKNVDVTKSHRIVAINAIVGSRKIDILINNAGVLNSETLGSIDYSEVLKQFDVNTLGPLRVTEGLIENLKSGTKVALITSRMGSITDNSSGGYYGYRMSKAALNAAAMSLTHDLKSKGVAVGILHPGFVQTDMVSHAGDISADTAAERLAQRIDELNMQNTGTFWHSSGDVLPW